MLLILVRVNKLIKMKILLFAMRSHHILLKRLIMKMKDLLMESQFIVITSKLIVNEDAVELLIMIWS